MSSIRRIISSRINGALSKGPKTAEGKRRCAAANLRHGLLSKEVLIGNEPPALLARVLREHKRCFKPSNAIERHMVEQIAIAYWRVRRAATVETRILNENLRKKGENQAGFDIKDAAICLPEGRLLDALGRYETRHRRAYERALDNLANLRKGALPSENLNFAKGPS